MVDRGAPRAKATSDGESTIEYDPAVAKDSVAQFAARLVRAFFQGNPAALWQTPQWVIQLLIEQLPTVEASEQLSQVNLVSYPHMKRSGQTRMLRTLKKAAKVNRPAPIKRYKHLPYDREAAQRWAIEQGYEVVQAG